MAEERKPDPRARLEERVRVVLDKIESLKKSLREISEVLKDSRLSELAGKLYQQEKALWNYMSRNMMAFTVEVCSVTDEYITVAIRRGHSTYAVITLPRNTSLIDIYREFFDSSEAFSNVLSSIVDVIDTIASEVAKRIDLFERIRSIETAVDRLRSEVENMLEGG